MINSVPVIQSKKTFRQNMVMAVVRLFSGAASVWSQHQSSKDGSENSKGLASKWIHVEVFAFVAQ